MAGAVGSAALRSHFGASLEDHGPNVVLYRAGPQTARRAGSLRGHDHSRQSSATPKPLHRPEGLPSSVVRRILMSFPSNTFLCRLCERAIKEFFYRTLSAVVSQVRGLSLLLNIFGIRLSGRGRAHS